MSRPIITYTVLTSFLGPWLDFIFAKVICRDKSEYYTVAIGLWKMLDKEYIDRWYASFAAVHIHTDSNFVPDYAEELC